MTPSRRLAGSSVSVRRNAYNETGVVSPILVLPGVLGHPYPQRSPWVSGRLMEVSREND